MRGFTDSGDADSGSAFVSACLLDRDTNFNLFESQAATGTLSIWKVAPKAR